MTVYDYYNFTHEFDAQALSAMRSIPGFDKALKAYMRGVTDRMIHMGNMSNKVLLSENQLPRVYRLLPPICERFGIEVPPLYLEFNPEMNAYTRGDNIPDVTITSGLLDNMNDEEVQIVMAHECGHIVCHPVLYQTMGSMVLSGAAAIAGIPLLGDALEMGFSYWMRCAEFSADRAAALFCGDGEKVARIMFRLAGATSVYQDEMNLELFMSQAGSYRDFMNDSNWNKFLNFSMIAYNSHPLLAVRASEIVEWCKQPDFANVCKALDEGAGQYTPPTPEAFAAMAAASWCQQCGYQNAPGTTFCVNCGNSLAAPMPATPSACPVCGAALQPDENFCQTCGTPVGGGSVAPAVAPQPTSTDKIRGNLRNAVSNVGGAASSAASRISSGFGR